MENCSERLIYTNRTVSCDNAKLYIGYLSLIHSNKTVFIKLSATSSESFIQKCICDCLNKNPPSSNLLVFREIPF